MSYPNQNRKSIVSEFPQINPFVIAIWCGEEKPVCNEFLEDFVHEMNSLINADGIMINNYSIKIRIKAIINDTPARSFIKGIVFGIDTENVVELPKEITKY